MNTPVARYAALGEALEVTEEQRQRGMSHLQLLEDMYRPRVDRIAELTMPSLLLLGETDLVAPPPVVERYRSDAPHGKVVVIEGAGHFAFVEQPTAYVAALRAFVACLSA